MSWLDSVGCNSLTAAKHGFFKPSSRFIYFSEVWALDVTNFINRNCWSTVLSDPAWQGVWTRWSAAFPSDLNRSVILWKLETLRLAYLKSFVICPRKWKTASECTHILKMWGCKQPKITFQNQKTIWNETHSRYKRQILKNLVCWNLYPLQKIFWESCSAASRVAKSKFWCPLHTYISNF